MKITTYQDGLAERDTIQLLVACFDIIHVDFRTGNHDSDQGLMTSSRTLFKSSVGKCHIQSILFIKRGQVWMWSSFVHSLKHPPHTHIHDTDGNKITGNLLLHQLYVRTFTTSSLSSIIQDFFGLNYSKITNNVNLLNCNLTIESICLKPPMVFGWF